jgi:hypothetical protein
MAGGALSCLVTEAHERVPADLPPWLPIDAQADATLGYHHARAELGKLSRPRDTARDEAGPDTPEEP